jgi:MYXO-CTERM domain-containing protein
MRLRVLGMSGLLLLTTPAWAGDVVSENEYEPFPGIRIVERTEANPNNRIRVAYVSLCTDRVHMTATAPPTSFRTPGAWGGDQGVQLAVNGDFYTSGPKVYGEAVGDGMPWPFAQTGKSSSGEWYYRRYGWIAFGSDWVEFNHTQRTKNQDAELFGISLGWRPDEVTEDIPSGTLALVSGFPELVIEGQTYTCSSPTASDCFPDRGDMRDRHPRTAMGLTEDRQTFILAVVDGRNSPTSVGMYGAELAALMADLGAWEAFNLDGGGSSAMWLQGGGYLNNPSDGSPRAVANHWGVFAGPEGGKSTEPGSCFTPGGCFPTALPGAEDEVFGDMPPGSYGHAEAIALQEADIIGGCQVEPRRLFCPHCPLRRAHAAIILVGAAGLDTSNPPQTPSFDDVAPDSSAYAAIEAAVAAGIMQGCSDTSFCPSGSVARGALAGMVRRAAGFPPGNASMPTYDDVGVGHEDFADVESLVEHCVSEPCGDGTFCPERDADRAEIAIMASRAFGLVPGAPCAPDPDDPDTGGTSGGSSAESGGSGDGSASAASQGDATSESSAGLPEGFGEDGGGCSCRAGPEKAGGVGLLGLLLLLGRRRRA